LISELRPTTILSTHDLELRVDYLLGGEPRYRIVSCEEPVMRIDPVIKECGVFIYARINGEEKPVGTGFLVGIEEETLVGRYAFTYLVTAKHVIIKIDEESIDKIALIRFNSREGGFRKIEMRAKDWISNLDDPSIDVAAHPWTVPYNELFHRYVPARMAATEEIIKKESIDVGDEIFYTGLFTEHPGRESNLPILRQGTIALMPEEKIWVKDFGAIDGFLIEARSIGGHSGSPVFVHFHAGRTVKKTTSLGSKYYWLGLMHGHYKRPDGISSSDVLDTLEEMNMGIGIVVPATKVLEILNQPAFLQQRNEELVRINAEHFPIPDSAHNTSTAS